MLARPPRNVIPAQAGIQMIEYLPQSGATPSLVRCAEFIFLLDTGPRIAVRGRLRRCDELVGVLIC